MNQGETGAWLSPHLFLGLSREGKASLKRLVWGVGDGREKVEQGMGKEGSGQTVGGPVQGRGVGLTLPT